MDDYISLCIQEFLFIIINTMEPILEVFLDY